MQFSSLTFYLSSLFWNETQHLCSVICGDYELDKELEFYFDFQSDIFQFLIRKFLSSGSYLVIFVPNRNMVWQYWFPSYNSTEIVSVELNLERHLSVRPYSDLNHTCTSTGLDKSYTGVVLRISSAAFCLKESGVVRLTYEIECIEKDF